MKYSCSKKWLFLAMFLLLAFAGCKKENLAKNFTGSYTGIATERSLPDMNMVTTYANCKIVISEVDRKKIRLTITRDPANSTSTTVVESIVQDANSFNHSQGARAQPTTTYDGSLQSRELVFTIDRVWSSGPEYEFQFQGLRD